MALPAFNYGQQCRRSPCDASTVVTEMVTQRRTMQAGMMKMQESMMGHMMEHMQAGKESMATCPMMKQMGGMK